MSTSAVNTKKVKGRRELHFAKLADIQAEAERLASIRVRQLGNWPLGYSLAHLAGAMKMSLDGADFRAPFYIRWFAPLIKKGLLRGPMKPGFQLPRRAAEELIPRGEVPTQDGLNQLRTQIERLNREPQRAPSPVFGKMTREEWDQLHLRHAEMHLSFYVPE
jgi:Protein of unknown function (DUF1569)